MFFLFFIYLLLISLNIFLFNFTFSFTFFLIFFHYNSLIQIKLNYFLQGGGGVGVVLKPKQYARLSNEVKYKKATIYTM